MNVLDGVGVHNGFDDIAEESIEPLVRQMWNAVRGDMPEGSDNSTAFEWVVQNIEPMLECTLEMVVLCRVDEGLGDHTNPDDS